MERTFEEQLDDFVETLKQLKPVAFVGHAVVYRETEDGVVGPEIVRVSIEDVQITLEEMALLHYGLSATVQDITRRFDDFENMLEYKEE